MVIPQIKRLVASLPGRIFRPLAGPKTVTVPKSRGIQYYRPDDRSRNRRDDRFDGPDQDRFGHPVDSGDHVRAPVDAVGAVHVQQAGRPEHGGVAGGWAPVGVARRVTFTPVRLHLDDAADPH